MEQKCSTCRHWHKAFQFYERADCLELGIVKVFTDSCPLWQAREPYKIRKEADDANSTSD